MSDSHPTEVFLTVPRFPLYRVSNYGQVQSLKPGNKKKGTLPRWKAMKIRVGKHGHCYVSLHVKGKGEQKVYVHHLVLQLFVSSRPKGKECCHNDGNPQNNFVGNLRWDTHKNNCADRVRHGTMNWGERGGKAKLTEADVRAIFLLRASGTTHSKIAEKFGIGQQEVSLILSGKRWKHLNLASRDEVLARKVAEEMG